MKKAILCVVLALLLIVLCEPHMRQAAVQFAHERLDGDSGTQVSSQTPSFAEQLGSGEKADTLDVTLYYRFLDTSVLGAQRVELDLRREETIAMRIVEHLVEGPGIAHDRLRGVFPMGTQVISVTGEERTAFVTLNEAFLGKPDGAPADWEDLSVW